MLPLFVAVSQAWVIASWVMAQADPGWVADAKSWATPVGALVALATGIFVPKYVVDRLDKQLTKVEGQRDDLAAQLAEMIPVLVQVNTTMIPSVDKSQAALMAHTAAIEELRRDVRDLTQEFRSRGRGV